jgi:hypothetical protein
MKDSSLEVGNKTYKRYESVSIGMPEVQWTRKPLNSGIMAIVSKPDTATSEMMMKREIAYAQLIEPYLVRFYVQSLCKSQSGTHESLRSRFHFLTRFPFAINPGSDKSRVPPNLGRSKSNGRDLMRRRETREEAILGRCRKWIEIFTKCSQERGQRQNPPGEGFVMMACSKLCPASGER